MTDIQNAPAVEQVAVTLLPCPFCNDPMQISEDGLLSHREQSTCPISQQAWGYRGAITAWNTRHPAATGSVREWKVVPVEPTDAMLEAGNAMWHRYETPLNIYRAMLAATPTQPEATGNDGAGQEATLEMRQAALDASRQSEPPFLPVGRELWAAQECWSVMFAAQTADAHTPTREG
jgi:hypothetical protein